MLFIVYLCTSVIRLSFLEICYTAVLVVVAVVYTGSMHASHPYICVYMYVDTDVGRQTTDSDHHVCMSAQKTGFVPE